MDLKPALLAACAIAACAIAACALAVQAAASEPSIEDWNISRHEWTGEAAEGTGVAIVNLHGDLRVRKGTGGELYLLAVIQRHNDDPRRAEVATEAAAGETRLEVRYPKVPDTETGEVSPGEAASRVGVRQDIPEAWKKRRVDLTVFVPAGARVTARTSTGLVELKGLTGDVEATSDSGDLRIRTAGGVLARTQHGDVLAQFRRTDWSGNSEIETLTGNIRVELPHGGRADVHIETRGEITTDYSIEIRRRDGSLLKLGTAKIGEDGGRLVLKSNRGAIRLIESLVPEQESAPQTPYQHNETSTVE